MITEAQRMFADVLSDPTYGVQAQLTALVGGGYLEAGDSAPGTVTIGDATRNTEPALGRNMDNAPISLTVFLVGAMPYDNTGEIDLLTGRFEVGIRIDTVGNLPAVSHTTTGYVLRAVSRSIRWWWRNIAGAAEDFNIRNGVQFCGGESIRPAMFGATAESPTQTFGIVATATFRDVLPN